MNCPNYNPVSLLSLSNVRNFWRMFSSPRKPLCCHLSPRPISPCRETLPPGWSGGAHCCPAHPGCGSRPSLCGYARIRTACGTNAGPSVRMLWGLPHPPPLRPSPRLQSQLHGHLLPVTQRTDTERRSSARHRARHGGPRGEPQTHGACFHDRH